MKCLIKFSLLFTLIVLSLGANLKNQSFVERREKKDPREVQKSAESLSMAFFQTAYARLMFYAPKQELITSLQKAATSLHAFITQQAITDELKKEFFLRLNGNDGIMKGKTPEDVIAVLNRVKDNSNVTPTDRIVVIALMGDIGALFTDTGATTGVVGKSDKNRADLRAEFNKFMKSKNDNKDYMTEEIIQEIEKSRGSKGVGPVKKEERGRKETDEVRTGIFNNGAEVDGYLKQEKTKTLPAVHWDIGIIEEERLKKLTEPLAGHMSGSPAEILFIWDVLLGYNPINSYLSDPATLPDSKERIKLYSRDEKAVRAAGAAGFLVAMGYHSAVEVIEGTYAYLGQNIRALLDDKSKEDAATIFGNGFATEAMAELFKMFIDPNDARAAKIATDHPLKMPKKLRKMKRKIK